MKNEPQQLCSNCGRKGVLITLTTGQMNFSSNIFKVKKVDPNAKINFCSIACLHEWIDKIVQE